MPGQLELLARKWAEGSQNPDVRSRSDRLRPPYVTPVPWADPKNIRSASELEQGYNSLPTAYRNLIQAAPQAPKVSVGGLQGLNASGLYLQDGELAAERRNAGIPVPAMMAEKPGSYAHELIHALIDRTPDLKARTNSVTEEQLARHVSGGQSGVGWLGFKPQVADVARDLDAWITYQNTNQDSTSRWADRLLGPSIKRPPVDPLRDFLDKGR